MKKVKLFFIVALAGLFLTNPLITSAGNENSNKSDKQAIYVESAKYTLPLVEKWIDEYNKTNPAILIRRAEKNGKTADLRIVTQADVTAETGKELVLVGRSALLPVTNRENPLVEKIGKKKFGKKDLKKLFFIDEDFDEEKKEELIDKLTVYSGNGSASGAAAFASFFGLNASGFRGKKVLGDDIYLLHAIAKDPSGVTVNNLSYIYDLNDRRLKDEIVLLPLNLKKDQQEIIRSENLDETLSLLESENVDLIPVLNVGFTYDTQSVATGDFLRWIISEGQKFNHEFGFLRLDDKTSAYQKSGLDRNLLTSK